MTPARISVRNLSVRFRTDEGLVTAVDGASFELKDGEVLGLVGESGSGKSVTAKSLMQLNAGNTAYGDDGEITLRLEDRDINVLSVSNSRDMLAIHGGAISMIFQEPMASFAPAITVGRQMVEQLLLHSTMSKREAKEFSIEMLNRVGISDARHRFDQYSFELSGGMRQRAMIAMALSTQPKVLIADEPTTALDVTIQAQVLDLMTDLVAEFGMAILLITHDLGVIAQTADRVAVMYLGKIVETGTVRQIIRAPKHPYTKGLLEALPNLDDLGAPLTPIAGDIPSPLERPAGCVFHTRCPGVIAGRCDAMLPEITDLGDGHQVSCFAVSPSVVAVS
jgi:oligopeptide/dipeptide ABC transporter ATP-binding protein